MIFNCFQNNFNCPKNRILCKFKYGKYVFLFIFHKDNVYFYACVFTFKLEYSKKTICIPNKHCQQIV